ncbi:O-antigen translocase [Escherichia coli]|nr:MULTISPECIES: O-antigen translocase [Escherichia]EEZ6178422.1 O-antigen translocase [Escherichia coli O65]AWJ98878.1 O-antigen translocase [Escherichia coli]EEY8900576.1 O-antigen translocase [Escherichia coli]EFC9787390.1 O-antigen translocase [Escherichia coli]EFG1065168.1 O-antigen translocase [Escherichia coli]
MKKLLSVTFFTGLLTLTRMLSGFIIAKVVAIYIGPSGMAMLGQLQTVITVLNGISTSPAGNGVVRYTAKYYKNGYDDCVPWWRASIRLMLIIIGIIIPVTAISSAQLAKWLFLDSSYYWVVLLCLIALPLSAFGNFLISVINGQQQFKRYILQSFISVLITAVIMIGFIINANIKGALIAVSLQNGLIGLMIIIGTLRQSWFKKKYLWGYVDKKYYKELFNYIFMALTSALAMPIALLVMRNLMIQKLGWEATGQWQAVWKISETYLSVLTIALSTYYLPRLSAIESRLLKREVNSTALVFIPIAIMLAFGIFIFKDYIISILFTREFLEARDLFAIQLIGDVLKIASWLYAFPMLSRGMTKWFISTEVFFSLSLIILSYLFINLYGLIGANMAYATNYFFYFIVVFFLIKPTKIHSRIQK